MFGIGRSFWQRPLDAANAFLQAVVAAVRWWSAISDRGLTGGATISRSLSLQSLSCSALSGLGLVRAGFVSLVQLIPYCDAEMLLRCSAAFKQYPNHLAGWLRLSGSRTRLETPTRPARLLCHRLPASCCTDTCLYADKDSRFADCFVINDM